MLLQSAGGLVSYIDENTLLPKFNLHIDPDKVFGRVSAGEVDDNFGSVGVSQSSRLSMRSLDFLL